MVTEAGKELLRNTINTAKFHNRILEENEMWKQWELECGLTMMVSDDDIIKRIKKNHHSSKHHKRDKSRSRSRSRYEMAKTRHGAGSSNDRWDHSGFAELYPDAAVPEKYPSTSSIPTQDRHKKKKKKSRHRSDSSDEEIWEEFKRPVQYWNRERTLRLIELLRDAPALWNINYPGYRDQQVKMKEAKKIASVFRVNEDEILAQIVLLMNEFHKEHDKLTLKNMKGTSAKFAGNKWFAYEHLTFLKYNKNERFFKTVKNDIRKQGKPQWVDSSDSYSESEDETSRPTANQSNRCIKSKDEKNDARGKKANYTCTNLPSYSDSADKKSRPSANQSSRCIKSKVQDEKKDACGKQASYACINLSSNSESEETFRPAANQSSLCVKSKARDEKSDVHGNKANYTCTNLPSLSNSVDETSRPSANQSSRCIKSKLQDEKKDARGKKSSYDCINLSSNSESEDETSRPAANQSSLCVKSKAQGDVHGNEANYTCTNLPSYSDSLDETFRPLANQSSSCINRVQDEKRDAHENEANSTCSNLPYVEAYLAQRDSFSVFGVIVAHRMREAKKSNRAILRAECEIDIILRKFETGFYDSPEDTFK